MDKGIGNWVTMHARRTPQRLALVDGNTGQRIGYGELERRTNALADALRARGVRKGDRVALMALNSPQFMEVVFAVAKLGAVLVPINFRLAAPEVRYILDDSAPAVLLVSPQVAAVAREAAAGTGVRHVVEMASAEQRAAGVPSAYEELIASASAARVPVPVTHDEVATLMYTSGTTGFPKGVMLTHGNHLWNMLTNVAMTEGLTAQDVNLVAAPLFHIGAFGIFTLPLVYLGGASVVLESFTPALWLEAVERHHPTLAFCVPAMWAALHAAGLSGRDLGSLRYAISGGAPCPVVLIEALRAAGLVFTEGFGLTETAPIASALDAADVLERAGSIGKPIAHVEYRIADESGQDVPAGETGELLIRGPNVFVGYWQKPEASAEALRGGWFHSGDLARQDEAGYYYIVDRKKDMVISGGENVYPAEVEQVLYRHPGIAEVAVIGTPDARWGEAVTAVIVPRAGMQLDEGELIGWCRERLAHFKCPRVVQFIDVLPRTATGKVLKRELRRRWTADGSAVQR
ncbi:o-succinylbenzoate--CoA ligase [Melaminivora suipulveris]|uniref:O-succinylbenzoate--CoA ligase n=1 Tax=Melaminivora suipulveris TaxID=2109913 RepID=A0A2R3QEG5_9BURK|nr:long-chain fatty acid--CoA ligase [Melaminivora suipulveris]AVO50181.1 o-succinylbenzoate--CoA ligase [Melaminivora suipulveris]